MVIGGLSIFLPPATGKNEGDATGDWIADDAVPNSESNEAHEAGTDAENTTDEAKQAQSILCVVFV